MADLHPGVEVGPSAVAGRGLLATVDLSAGTTVLRLPDAATAARIAELGAGFPNHGCEANLGWVGERLVTTLDVPAGTELLVDYATAIADPSWLLRCHCPSYRCRQMVEGTDWQLPQLQRRYAGWFAPAVQRLIDG